MNTSFLKDKANFTKIVLFSLLTVGIIAILFFATKDGGRFMANIFTSSITNGWQVVNGTPVEVQYYTDAANTQTACKKVTNSNASGIFVPTKTKAEWDAFVAYTPQNVVIGNCGTSPNPTVTVTPPPTTCTPNATIKCSSNSLYYYDSCGTRGSFYQTCTSGCTTGNTTCSTSSPSSGYYTWDYSIWGACTNGTSTRTVTGCVYVSGGINTPVSDASCSGVPVENLTSTCTSPGI